MPFGGEPFGSVAPKVTAEGNEYIVTNAFRRGAFRLPRDCNLLWLRCPEVFQVTSHFFSGTGIEFLPRIRGGFLQVVENQRVESRSRPPSFWGFCVETWTIHTR